MGGTDREAVLLVSESTELAATMASLDLPYTVRTARTRARGAELLDPSVGILLVDDRLPDDAAAALVRVAGERDLSLRTGLLARASESCPERVDVVLSLRPDERELLEAIERLASLRTYDTRIERLYELAKRRSRAEQGRAVGDGGVEHVGDDIRAAREAADEAMVEVRREDHLRLLDGPAGGQEEHR